MPREKSVVQRLLGIEHDMTWNGLFECVPPAYTEWIGTATARPGARGGRGMIDRIEVPKSLWISANDRMHWAQKSKRTKALRQQAKEFALEHGIRDLGTTHVAAFIGYPRGGKADPANAAPTVKALIDGFVDAGAWPDERQHLRHRPHLPARRHQWHARRPHRPPPPHRAGPPVGCAHQSGATSMKPYRSPAQKIDPDQAACVGQFKLFDSRGPAGPPRAPPSSAKRAR